MGTTSQQAVTKFTELGNPVAAASNYTELKNESLFVCLNCVFVNFCVLNFFSWSIICKNCKDYIPRKCPCLQYNFSSPHTYACVCTYVCRKYASNFYQDIVLAKWAPNKLSSLMYFYLILVINLIFLILYFSVDAVYSSIYFDQKQQRFVNKAHSSVQGDGHLLPPPLNYIADSLYIRLMHIVANIGDISPAYQFLKYVSVYACAYAVPGPGCVHVCEYVLCDHACVLYMYVCVYACVCTVTYVKVEQHCRKNTDSLQLTGWDLYNYPRELDRQKVV